jgi:hypothetical protein
MQAKLLAIISLALWAWVLPAAHAMPLDADGPSGLSDDADFDDLIVSITSLTAAVTPVLVKIAAPWSMALETALHRSPDLRTNAAADPSSVEGYRSGGSHA